MKRSEHFSTFLFKRFLLIALIFIIFFITYLLFILKTDYNKFIKNYFADSISKIETITKTKFVSEHKNLKNIVEIYLKEPNSLDINLFKYQLYKLKNLKHFFIIKKDEVIFNFGKVRILSPEEILKFNKNEISLEKGILSYILVTKLDDSKIISIFNINQLLFDLKKEIEADIHLYSKNNILLTFYTPEIIPFNKSNVDKIVSHKNFYFYTKYLPDFNVFIVLKKNKSYFTPYIYNNLKFAIAIIIALVVIIILITNTLKKYLIAPLNKFSNSIKDIEEGKGIKEITYTEIIEFNDFLKKYYEKLATIKESEQNLLKILNTLEMGIYIIDKDYNLKFMNEAEKHFINTNNEVINKKCYQVFANRNTPCEGCNYLSKIEATLSDFINIAKLRNNNDPRKYAVIKSYKISDNFLIAIHDYTITMQLNKKIQYEKEKLETVINHVKEGIALINFDGSIDIANQAFYNITCFDKNTNLINELILESNGEKYNLLNLPDTSNRYYFTNNKNQTYILNIFKAPLFFNTKGEGFLIVLYNITDEVHREMEELRKNKLESIGLLAGGIAHDFNNILASIKNYISLVKLSGADSIDVIYKIDEIVDQGKNISNKLFTLSSGDIVKNDIINLKEIINTAKELSLAGSNITLDLNSQLDNVYIKGDETQIFQVFQNLFINAKEAMKNKGKITVFIETKYISKNLMGLTKGDYALIRVKDNGPGIEEGIIDKIFDPYFSTKERGSGLGLFITYNIIKNHNGHISVKSIKGEGTEFIIYLPLVRKQDEKAQNENIMHLGRIRKRILVVDDDFYIRDSMNLLMKSIGCSVKSVATGEEAIEMLQTEKFDIIFADVTVKGGMGAKDLIKYLIKNKIDVKTVVMSGYSDDDLLSNYQIYGFAAALKKPINIDDIYAILENLSDEGKNEL
ncbi:ATP-binding protein [Deferribacter thermophilus]|uniref:hybrid sensor histidine kinase/response regulator n=1 Tax=Deferribacter thermophilus TaxID=53573 RepID=UPI003C26450C